MACVMTSSPTRLINWSTLLTATRMVAASSCALLAAALGPVLDSAASVTAAGVDAAAGAPGDPGKKPKPASALATPPAGCGAAPGAPVDTSSTHRIVTCSLATWNTKRSSKSSSDEL